MHGNRIWKAAPPLVGALLAAVALSGQSITIPNTFVNDTTADAIQVNANFTALATNALNRNSGTMLGTLNSRDVIPTTDNAYDLGSTTFAFRNLYTKGTTRLGGVTYTWPVADGTSGYVLSTNGAGTLSFISSGLLTVTAVKTTAYTAAVGEFVPCNGTFTVMLPASSGNTGRIIDVKNIGTGTVTVDGNAAETIDGTATFGLVVQYQEVTVVSDGVNWYIR